MAEMTPLKAMKAWNRFGKPATVNEGWGLFHRSDGFMEIEAIDDLEGQPASKPLANDLEAIRHVAEQAIKGSRPHILALYLDGQRGDRRVFVPLDCSPLDTLEGHT